MQLSRLAVMFATGLLLSVGASPAPWPARAPPRGSQAKRVLAAAAQVLHTPLAESQVQSRALFADSKNRVVASSLLATGVRFIRVRRQSPPQQISVIVVTPRARIRAVHVQAGPAREPFATVSSAVKRTHALAGINGMPIGLNGQPMLVRESRIVPSSDDGPWQERHPRTGIGLTRDGSALFVTVDGRRTTAVGMTLREFAVFMRALGAVWAVNLDGGASTTMVAGGKVTNSPSDRFGERLVGYAVVLLTFGRPGMSHLVGQLQELEYRVHPAAGVQGIGGGYP
jgi:hypothetical protein